MIPASALNQFRATASQQEMIDDMAKNEGTGFYSEATAAEKSATPNWASEDQTTVRAASAPSNRRPAELDHRAGSSAAICKGRR